MRLPFLVAGLLVGFAGAASGAPEGLIAFSGKVRGVPVYMVTASSERYALKATAASGKVGATAELAAIARLRNGVAAVNGCYFDAYSSSPVKPPWHHLILDGSVEHIGDVGTTLGFGPDGSYRMERLRIRIWGSVSQTRGRPARWWAYRMNTPPGSSGATVYTNRYTRPSTPAAGSQVVVDHGVVARVSTGPERIPDDGYVIVFTGGEMQQWRKFGEGARVEMEISHGSPNEDFWVSATDAIGCGPRLVAGGRVACDPGAEGFTEAKVVNGAGMRGFVGVKGDGALMLGVVGGTPQAAAAAVASLGAVDAYCTDGGASRGFWLQGRYVGGKPGRQISNAWVLVPR